MRKLIAVLVCVCCFMVAGAGTAVAQLPPFLQGLAQPPGAAPGPLDVPRLNSSMAALLGQLVRGDASIESWNIAFDPTGSDLGQDRLAATTDMALRHTAWSAEPSRLHVEAQAKANVQTPGAARATINFRLSLDTQAVAAAEYAIRRYQTNRCGSPPQSAASADDYFVARLCEKLARTPQLKNFEDLSDLVRYISALRFLSENDEIDRLKSVLSAATDLAQRQAISDHIAQERGKRDRMAGTQLQFVRDPAGNLQAIAINLVNVEVGPALLVQRADVVIGEHNISVTGQAELRRGVELYALLKPVIVLTLNRLAQRDPAAVAQQQAWLQMIWGQIRPILIGLTPPTPAPGAGPQLSPTPAQPAEALPGPRPAPLPAPGR